MDGRNTQVAFSHKHANEHEWTEETCKWHFQMAFSQVNPR